MQIATFTILPIVERRPDGTFKKQTSADGVTSYRIPAEHQKCITLVEFQNEKSKDINTTRVAVSNLGKYGDLVRERKQTEDDNLEKG